MKKPLATDKVYDFALVAMLSSAACLSLYALFAKLNGPIIDAFGFRQTQTAISVFYMLRGSAIFAYETPVLGYPWAIPFEFPTYQAIVAIFSSLFGHLDATGRIVSYVFFLLCAYPISRLYKLYDAPRLALPITIILGLASPLYVLYSRAFLIETTALFFSLMWLWLFASELKAHLTRVALICAGLGTVAMLTKSTTFLSVAIFALVLLVPHVIQQARLRSYRAAAGCLILAAAVTLPPIAIGYGWVMWTDSIRSMNRFGDFLSSANLWHWNFGYPGQRQSAEFWKVVAGRIPVDVFGYASLAALLPIGVSLAWRQTRLLAFAAVATVMGGLLIFPNLHFVHSYYQTSIAIFAMMACALGVSAIYEITSKPLALVILISIAGSQQYYSYKYTLRTITADHKYNQTYAIARLAKKLTSPTDVLIVFGADWSSEIPYYAERKSLSVPGWASDDQLAALVRAPQDFLGTSRLGGLVLCAPAGRPAMQAAADQLIVGMALKGEVAACKLYTPT